MSEEIYKLKYLKYKTKYFKLLAGGADEILERSITTSGIDADTVISIDTKGFVKLMNTKIKKIYPNYNIEDRKSKITDDYFFNVFDGPLPNNSNKISHFSFHKLPKTKLKNIKRSRKKSSWHYVIDQVIDPKDNKFIDKVYNVYFEFYPDISNIIAKFIIDADTPERDKVIMGAFEAYIYDIINK